MSWYHVGNECLRCNNYGIVPVFDYSSANGQAYPREKVFECGCNFSKQYMFEKQKETTDDNGKRRTIKKVFRVSKNFDESFGRVQFPWNEKIAFSVDPKIDYQEVFRLFVYASLKEYRAKKEMVILNDIEILRQYVKEERSGDFGKISKLIKGGLLTKSMSTEQGD